MSILITGATGNVGSEVVRQLANAGAPVTAAVRNAEKAALEFARQGLAIPCKSFDYAKPETWQHALEGVESIFLIVPPGTTESKDIEAFFKKALAAGVRRLVFHSGRSTGDLPGEPLNVTEGLVRQSGIAWTILRPGWFMQNFLNWVGFTIPAEAAFYLPAADAKTAFVDVRDIAAVAVEALTKPGHEGQLYEPTSSRALDHFEVAQIISKAAGRSIRYVHLDDESFVVEMMKRGWSRASAEHTVFLYRIVRTGKEAAVSGDVERLLHRQPVDFEQFAQDYASNWERR